MTDEQPIRTFGAATDDDAPVNILDALRADFADKVAEGEETEVFPVPGRPGYAIRCATVIDHEELQAWTRRARDTSMPGGVNELKLSATILANACRAIVRDGVDVPDGDGPLTFASPTLHDILGVKSPRDAIRKFYGRDAHVVLASHEVLREAGYADSDDLKAGPTSG